MENTANSSTQNATNTHSAITGAALYEKLAALGNDTYSRLACDRYADMSRVGR